jgi:hypothetical protein
MSQFDTFHAKRQMYIDPPPGGEGSSIYCSVSAESGAYSKEGAFRESLSEVLGRGPRFFRRIRCVCDFGRMGSLGRRLRKTDGLRWT